MIHLLSTPVGVWPVSARDIHNRSKRFNTEKGRSVRLGFPHRLWPDTSPHALRTPPHGGHPALRSTTSSGYRSALAVSSFRLRARLDIHTFCFLRPVRNYPAFGYGAPHSSARGTLTILSSALLSAQYEPFRLPRESSGESARRIVSEPIR